MVCDDLFSKRHKILSQERLVANATMLDSTRTRLPTLCYSERLPAITTMINSYFTTSVIPSAYTCAIEKNQNPALDNDMLHNYRPVSNLPFVSKLRDRVVAKQLNAHLYESEIHNPFHTVEATRDCTHPCQKWHLRNTWDWTILCQKWYRRCTWHKNAQWYVCCSNCYYYYIP